MDLVRAFDDQDLAIDSVARLGGDFLLADTEGGQLTRVDSDGRVLDRWSRLSPYSIPVDQPIHLAQVDDESAVVYLGATKSTVTIDQSGRVLQTSTLDDFFGFDLTRSHQLWVGRPWSGALVTTYDTAGNELGGVGALKTFDETYPGVEEPSLVDVVLRDPFLFLNLVHVEADDRGGAFLTFRFAPIVQRYDHAGRLLWEARLQGREVKDLEELYLGRERREQDRAVRMEVHGMAASLVTLGAAFDPATGQLHVLLANQRIVRLGQDGRQGLTFLPRFSEGDMEPYPFLLTIHSLRPGTVLFTNPILAKSWITTAQADVLDSPSGE